MSANDHEPSGDSRSVPPTQNGSATRDDVVRLAALVSSLESRLDGQEEAHRLAIERLEADHPARHDATGTSTSTGPSPAKVAEIDQSLAVLARRLYAIECSQGLLRSEQERTSERVETSIETLEALRLILQMVGTVGPSSVTTENPEPDRPERARGRPLGRVMGNEGEATEPAPASSRSLGPGDRP